MGHAPRQSQRTGRLRGDRVRTHTEWYWVGATHCSTTTPPLSSAVRYCTYLRISRDVHVIRSCSCSQTRLPTDGDRDRHPHDRCFSHWRVGYPQLGRGVQRLQKSTNIGHIPRMSHDFRSKAASVGLSRVYRLGVSVVHQHYPDRTFRFAFSQKYLRYCGPGCWVYSRRGCRLHRRKQHQDSPGYYFSLVSAAV